MFREDVHGTRCGQCCACMNSLTLKVTPGGRNYYYSHRKGRGGPGSLHVSPSPPWCVVESGFGPGAQQAPRPWGCIGPQFRWEGTYGSGVQIPLAPTQQGFPGVGLVSNTPTELTGAEGISCFIRTTADPYYGTMARDPNGNEASCERESQQSCTWI